MSIEQDIEAQRIEIKLLERAIKGRPSALEEVERLHLYRASIESHIEI